MEGRGRITALEYWLPTTRRKALDAYRVPTRISTMDIRDICNNVGTVWTTLPWEKSGGMSPHKIRRRKFDKSTITEPRISLKFGIDFDTWHTTLENGLTVTNFQTMPQPLKTKTFWFECYIRMYYKRWRSRHQRLRSQRDNVFAVETL